MTEICALASGSNGNAYYIGNETEAILIDAGIYYKRLAERMEAVGLNPQKIKAIFVSHEHTDHISGLRSCCKRLNIPAYLSEKTYHNTRRAYLPEFVRFFDPGMDYYIEDIAVHPFRKSHDSADPFSFRIVSGNYHIGVMTDIGIADKEVITQFNRCHAVFLESNYDETMLWQGSYPPYIKQRVASEAGHLSNLQALNLLEECASPHLQYVILSHISDQNNTKEIVLKTFARLSGKYHIRLAGRDGVSELIRF